MTFDIHIKKIVPKIILSPQGHCHKYVFYFVSWHLRLCLCHSKRCKLFNQFSYDKQISINSVYLKCYEIYVTIFEPLQKIKWLQTYSHNKYEIRIIIVFHLNYQVYLKGVTYGYTIHFNCQHKIALDMDICTYV